MKVAKLIEFLQSNGLSLIIAPTPLTAPRTPVIRFQFVDQMKTQSVEAELNRTTLIEAANGESSITDEVILQEILEQALHELRGG